MFVGDALMSEKGSKPDIEPGNVSVCFVPLADNVTVDRRLYFVGGGATFSSHQSNLVEPSFASLPGMSEFSLSLTPE
jgi:hypothetical protein